MNALRLLVVGVVMCSLSAGVKAEEKKADNAALLLGKWEATKCSPNTLPVGAVVEFAKDGKMTVTIKVEGKEMALAGTYKVDGNKFTINLKVGDKEEKKTITIKKINDKEMSTEDEAKLTVEFKRVK